ncbi:hypothetical protein CN601_22265, partial [Bacillus sp. AFS017336]
RAGDPQEPCVRTGAGTAGPGLQRGAGFREPAPAGRGRRITQRDGKYGSIQWDWVPVSRKCTANLLVSFGPFREDAHACPTPAR